MSSELAPDIALSFDTLSLALAEDLAGIEDCAPVNLIEKFPRIIHRINATWPARACVDYIDSLMIANRQDRAGFPPAIVSELFFLKELHSYLYPLPYKSASPWMEYSVNLPSPVRSLRALADRFGPRKRADKNEAVSAELRDPPKNSATEYRNWGELKSEAEICDFLTANHSGKTKIGDVLVHFGAVSEKDRDDALAAQRKQSVHSAGKSDPLGKILVRAGKLNPIDIRKALAFQANVPLLHLDALGVAPEVQKLMLKDLALKLGVLPVLRVNQRLVVAMEDPLSFRAIRAVEVLGAATGLEIKRAWATAPAIERKLKNYL